MNEISVAGGLRWSCVLGSASAKEAGRRSHPQAPEWGLLDMRGLIRTGAGYTTAFHKN